MSIMISVVFLYSVIMHFVLNYIHTANFETVSQTGSARRSVP